MDEVHKNLPQSLETKNVLPDVVHSQQITALESEEKPELDTGQNSQVPQGTSMTVESESEAESVSEQIPSKIEYSLSETVAQSHTSELLKVEPDHGNEYHSGSLQVISHSQCISPSAQNQHFSASWNLDVDPSDAHISNESPINLPISSDTTSKDVLNPKSESSESSEQIESHKTDYLDSLNDNVEQQYSSKSSDGISVENTSEQKVESPKKSSSGSDEIIKLDIRGKGAPQIPLQSAKIIFGPPPDGAMVVGATLGPIPVFPILTPRLGSDDIQIEKIFEAPTKDVASTVVVKEIFEGEPEKSLSSEGSEQFERDVLVEEVTLECEVKEKSDGSQPKSFVPEETMSFSTMTTDYKTICEEYQVKLVHFEEAITQRDQLIEDLKTSLQRSTFDYDRLKQENGHLCSEVQALQHVIAEQSHSEHDTIKGQLSDFMKYQSMVKEDSTKFYSAITSRTGSIQSSNGEKDMEREEMTVNYSKSDLQSASESDDFQTGFENKLSILLNKFEGFIEDNMRNKLRESLIQVLCDEIGKMRIEFDTDIRDFEAQMQQDKQQYANETRRLRELLASVKSGNADINELKKELSLKYEKEMVNLRMFFEKKCSDMELSYSEEVRRDRACASPSGSEEDGAGDARRRTRSADLPSLRMETSTPIEFMQKHSYKKLEQQIEDLKAEHLAYINELQARHKEEIASLEEQITHLKAHIQTTENTEANVSLYQQDIDLELEKARRDDTVRADVLQQLQDQLQVLLSDPDADLSTWPLELVALRDKIHGDKSLQEKELSSLRDEAPGGEADKWRQRRNYSFDQNRQLEEVTKERDGLKRVAAVLRRALSQLVEYCASAEDELNRTVLAALLPHLLQDDSATLELDSRPSSPLELETSSSKRRVHFAPDLDAILGSPDALALLQQQRDLSADVKKELKYSLRRLQQDAHDLLALSGKLAANKQNNDMKMLESSAVEITELVEELDNKHSHCDNCDMQKKSMEECLQREGVLRSELDGAMMRIAQLLAAERVPAEVLEGYGTGGHGEGACGACGARGAGLRAGDASPRAQHEIDELLRQRDDLQQQLEAANRQLKSTRKFVEEQASEREAERDEFAKRLEDLREENVRFANRLQSNAMILAEVEQLESQAREMTQTITELENRRYAVDEELKASEEKVILLRDIIANLENQLEQKANREKEVLEELEAMKRTIDERDGKIRAVLGELESLRSERVDNSELMCAKCEQEQDRYEEYVEKIKDQAQQLAARVHARTRRLERAHERASAPASEPSEDVSLRDRARTVASPDSACTPRVERMSELADVWECVDGLARAEDALLKRLADLEMQRASLSEVAQEVRAERDVLQARMSEQALKISSLAARLERQRNDAHALAHTAASQLSVQLHDAQAEVQRLKEELESKDKQLSRLKQNSEERELLSEKHAVLYGNSCNPKDKVIILERELSTAQSRIAQLESLASELQEHNDKLRADVEEQRAVLLDKEEQLNQIMALKLEEEQIQKSEIVEGKTSGRTLSDIVSISEYDEQDLQMRRAELKQNNSSLTDAPHKTGEKTPNRTLPPEVQRPYMSSLNIDYVENTDVFSPRAESLPANFTPAQNKDKFKRNVNETTIFGTIDKFGESVKHSTAQNIQDNCSMYPNQNVSVSNNISVEPKKINFSLEPSENKTFDDFTSLQELGITLDLKQENFPDILSQLKHEIKKSRSELENCRTELKNAEEQLCEFPAIKEEVEELKSLLENTMATMEKDKKYYESQLENFSSNKNILEQKLSALQQELNEKSKDLNLLKEDILRRETMILELAKEKRNLTGKISELESRINELQNKNVSFEKYETENKQLRDRISELQKLEQLVTEKNQQIDSLNQHLDRLDDLQRRLNDRTEEVHNLKQALQDKSNELFQMQDSVVALNRDMTKVVEENDHLSSNNQELKLRLTKLEKEQENASLKLQNSENELEKVNSINSELTSRIEELKHLSEEMRLKQAKIDMLNEDMKSYHNEIASLKEQLEIVSRSPSPKSKSGEEMRQAGDDRKQLARIKKQIALLQHELDFNKKDLNDKAFELAKAKQDVLELKDNLSQAVQKALVSDQNDQELRSSNQELQREIQGLQAEKQQLAKQLEIVLSRLREESNVSELKQKLKDKSDRCRELEVELSEMRELVERLKGTGMELSTRERASRSPTAELERALRLQLQHSRSLDEDIIEILSASSDEREDIPRLALNSSNSSGAQSSGCARLERARGECERLRGAADSLRARLLDKDALIAELHRTREQLSEEVGRLRASEQTQRDLAARLQLQLDAALQQHDALQKQDSSMISMLKRRLESAMNLELELREREQQLLQRQNQPSQQTQHNQPSQPSSPVSTSSPRDKLALEAEESGARLLRAQLTLERERGAQMRRDAERALEAAAAAQRDRDAAAAHHASELAALCRLKHEAGVELVRAKELISIQAATIRQLEDKLATTHAMRDAEAGGPRRDDSALSADEKEQAIRYLQGRCLRVESWRKALIWQKRYLQRVIAGYQTAVSLAEKSLATPITQAPPLAPKQRFRCVVNVVRTVLRMGYLVRRRQHVRALAAACILSDGAGAHTPTNQLRDRFSTPLPRTNHAREHARATPTYTQNYTPLPKAPPLTLPRTTKLGNNLARRLLKHDVGLNISADNLEEAGRRSPYTSSPRDHRFILSSPREVPSAHQSELDAPAARPRALYRDTP